MAKKYTDEIIAQAKLLYMKEVPIPEIALQLDIKRSAVYYHIKKSWEEEKALQGAELFRELSNSKKESFAKMINSSQSIVNSYLKHLEDQTTLDSKDVKVALQVLTELDKITRLDDANPDDGLDAKEKPITPADLRKRLNADPFAKSENK